MKGPEAERHHEVTEYYSQNLKVHEGKTFKLPGKKTRENTTKTDEKNMIKCPRKDEKQITSSNREQKKPKKQCDRHTHKKKEKRKRKEI